jgi:hypothetical protein
MQSPTREDLETMHMRRALPAAALTGSIVFLGTVLALGATRSPAPAPTKPALTPQDTAPSTTEVSTTALFATAVSNLTAADEDHVSVAVENLGTGMTASYNVGDGYVTASIVKLDILCTMLYQDQRSNHSPTDSELSLTTTMIEDSNNDAAQHLFEDEGGANAITAANKVFGLTDTAVEKNSLDEAGYSWGDTTTTVLDQLALLRQVFTPDSVLTAAHRDYIKGLLAKVEPGERWGVSAAADDPSPTASDYLLKNGWLPRKANAMWEINSIGEVQHDGQQYLVAVLSNDNKTMDSGIGVVQKVAEEAVDAGA